MEQRPSQTKVFISYSHQDIDYREALLPALLAVRSVGPHLWYDAREIDYGDKFHDDIQQALAATKIGVLLVSNHFLISEYIRQHELPFLLQQAALKRIKLGILYVTDLAASALEIPVDVNGEPCIIDLKAYHAFNTPKTSLETLPQGETSTLYAKLADWLRDQLKPSPTSSRAGSRTGPRYDLSVALQARRRHWEHSFSLPHASDFVKPELDCPRLDEVLGSRAFDVNGQDVFELVFGREAQLRGQLLGAAFEAPEANPTRQPLRLHVLTDDDRLYQLPWGRIEYGGQPLVDEGWTVEFHGANASGFPEFPSHTCYFPGKVLLVGAGKDAKIPHATTHFQDALHFFQRHWPQMPTPTWCSTTAELREALSTGSTRLVYYFGAASSAGLHLESDDPPVAWATFAEWLQQSQSVSAVFLNLIGEDTPEVIPQGRQLLHGAVTVLFQCAARDRALDAAKAGIDWLTSVFAAPTPLDPVVALHRHQCGQVIAWTRYDTWRTVAPPRVDIPDLVNLLLDRWNQRASILQAKEDFYTYKLRRIYQAVAMGISGCRVDEFPHMASQHLRQNKRDREVFFYQRVDIHDELNDAEDVDDCIREALRVASGQSIINALLKPELMGGNDFWFLVLGWVLPSSLRDADMGERLLRSVAEWCRTILAEDVSANPHAANIRVISILAMQTEASETTGDLEERILDAMDDLNDAEAFHLGELGPLAGVRRSDLQNYFRDEQICSCDDRYRNEFPRLLLGPNRREMPFDEAVATIRRGDPNNWGNLHETLSDMTDAGTWPPAAYNPDFWETRDAGA